MNICKQCGVELEDDIKSCPICYTQISSGKVLRSNIPDQLPPEGGKRHLMQRILWQITVVLLLSGVVATLIINLSIVGRVTWSIYPISICLMILSYASLMALWRTAIIFQLFGGWFISALILVLVNQSSQGNWPILLALPILSAINIIGIVLYFLLVSLKTKGLNVLALIFVSFAVSSLAIEAIISMYFKGEIRLGWSVIVAACLLPVTTTIVFMYFRTRSNSDLQKIFHT
jgi:hypothetical protein